jgi:hypothetical protein
MAESPTSRSLKLCRKRGQLPWVVEIWNPYGRRPDGRKGIRQDLYGFIDIIAIGGGLKGVLGIQATSYSCVSARVNKIKNERTANALAWLSGGNQIEVWGWKKTLVGKVVRWAPRVVEITEEDMPECETKPTTTS